MAIKKAENGGSKKAGKGQEANGKDDAKATKHHATVDTAGKKATRGDPRSRGWDTQRFLCGDTELNAA